MSAPPNPRNTQTPSTKDSDMTETATEPKFELGAPVRVIQYGKRWVGRVMGWHKSPKGKLRYSVHRDGDIRNHNITLRPHYIQSIWDNPGAHPLTPKDTET